MTDPSPHELTIYVESRKTIRNFYRQVGTVTPTSPAIGTAPVAQGETRSISSGTSVTDEPVYFLSDDQARCVALAEDLGKRRGYMIKVVDIAKSGRLERLVTERLKGIAKLPALVSDGEARIEGVEEFTEERICELMPCDLKNVRAFTYLKVKGGNFDALRESLVTFAQVKEMHFLTGDWDIFVVLEFPPGSGRKREVLDFVTERLRALPDIVDTSTVVPEYTITKYPY
ncbi:MAG: Lrp/AsnC family transcriptional regulator [Thermoplasmata archaeon]